MSADIKFGVREMGCQDWPIYGTGRFLIHAIVVHVPDNSDHLTPVIFRVGADLLAQGKRGIVPVFARHLFRDDGERDSVVDIVPDEVAASHEWSAECLEEAGRDKPEAAKWYFTL